MCGVVSTTDWRVSTLFLYYADRGVLLYCLMWCFSVCLGLGFLNKLSPLTIPVFPALLYTETIEGSGVTWSLMNL